MKIRFRFGPFTFGKSGTRLSLWKGGSGVSIPLSEEGGRSFGKLQLGPFTAYFGDSAKNNSQQNNINSDEHVAIQSFAKNSHLINRLKENGVPWMSIQVCLKNALPDHLNNRNDIAYKLVPKAMGSVFGKQNTAWKTEKRPSATGKGGTTWVILI